MLHNYLKTTWRNLKQNKSYTLINFVGLMVGMTCCILIALYVKSELSYDDFNLKENRIAAVGYKGPYFGKGLVTPFPLVSTLKEKVPGVNKAVILKSVYNVTLGIDKDHFIQLNWGKYTESSFFDIFSFPLLKGNKNTALSEPNSIVLTQKAADKLFGKKGAMGQTLFWQRSDTTKLLTVTGIVGNPPKNSSLQFSALISMKTYPYIYPTAWHAFSFSTFALLNKQTSFSHFNHSLASVAKKHYKKEYKKGHTPTFFAIPFASYHLSSIVRAGDNGFTGKSMYLYLFGSIALFILIIACINYVNLATARATTRAREVGVRKTLGAGRRQVIGQFLGESVILSICSYSAAIYLSFLLIHPFNHLFGSTITFASHFPLLGWLALASILVGILAGSYPALYLSGFAPASVFRSSRYGLSSSEWLRKALVVVQFAIASIFIIGSVVVYRQLYYTQNVNLGFNGHQVAVFNIPTKGIWQNRKNVRRVIAALPGVKNVSIASGAPANMGIMLGNKPQKLSPQARTVSNNSIMIMPAVVDYNYLQMLDIKLLAGRTFSPSYPSDREGAFILNKKAVQALGWTPKGAIGKTFQLGGVKGKVIGVTQNFHIASLHQQIKPVVLQLKESKTWSAPGMLLAKLDGNHIRSAVKAIKSKLKTFAPHSAFDVSFLDQKFNAMYRSDRRFGKVIGLFALIAIIIGCLGLFGLAAFSTQRRTKEIGIRKVLGATTANIVSLLSKDFLKLVAIGFVIAVPVGWYAMHRWLQNFAYKIHLSPWIFILAGVIAVIIALATVSWQSIRAALANPVDSLRSE